MNETLQREYDWLNVSKGVYITVRYSREMPGMDAKFKHQRQLRLLLPSGSLGFFVINTLGRLPQASSGNQFVIVITNRNSNLTPAFRHRNCRPLRSPTLFHQLDSSMRKCGYYCI